MTRRMNINGEWWVPESQTPAVVAPAPQNVGHGHVTPRPDGVKARCGGPRICSVCALELARKEAAQ